MHGIGAAIQRVEGCDNPHSIAAPQVFEAAENVAKKRHERDDGK
jgi:hypothetical protein